MGRKVASPACVVSQSGSTTTVAVRGEIDISNVAQLRACLTGCLADGCTDITVDMHDLAFIDVRGLSVLAEVTKLAACRGRHLTLENPPPFIRRLMDIAGLATLAPVTNLDSPIQQPER